MQRLSERAVERMIKVRASRVVGRAVALAMFLVAGGSTPAWAQTSPTSPTPAQPQPAALTVEAAPSGSADANAASPSIPPPAAAAATSPSNKPAASSVTAPKAVGPAPSAAPPPNVTSAVATNSAVYGVAVRARWISVPKWFLNIFTQANMPLSSYHVGAEFFRRKGDYDLVLGLSYQSMSPADGNWLGPTQDASNETDYVQFKGLGLISFDVGLVWHQAFTDWLGMHYGGGIGIGVVTGKMLRTSSWGSCTKANIRDVSQCHPDIGYPFTEEKLQSTEGGNDEPKSPHRFQDHNIPSVIPVLNIIVGLDFKLPTIPGVEFRIDGGFFDAFYLGGAVAYVFL